MPPQLIGLRGSLIGQVVPLGLADAVLGRDASSTIVVADQTVGRRHAAVRPSAGGYVIEDLGSTNGTFVNDVRISGPTPLKSGDTIRIGEQLLRFESTAGQPKVAAPPRMEVSRGEAGAAQPPVGHVPLF